MTKQTTTTLTIAAAYGIALTLVLAYAYVTVQSQKTEAVQLRTTLAEQNTKQQAATAVAVTIDATASDRAKLTSYFLSEKETITFIADVEALAATLGVTIETTGLDIVRPADNPAGLKISFAVSGTRTQVLQFMEAMENIPYHSTISTMRVGRETGQVWSGSLDMLITLRP